MYSNVFWGLSEYYTYVNKCLKGFRCWDLVLKVLWKNWWAKTSILASHNLASVILNGTVQYFEFRTWKIICSLSPLSCMCLDMAQWDLNLWLRGFFIDNSNSNSKKAPCLPPSAWKLCCDMNQGIISKENLDNCISVLFKVPYKWVLKTLC